MTSRRRPASRMAGGGGGLLLLVASLPREAASFAPPQRQRRAAPSSIGGGAPRTTQLRLAARPAYLDPARPLESIADHPHLFPTTSSYVRALQSRSLEVPSAEEFLTQLSAELARASREGTVAFHSAGAGGYAASAAGGLEQAASYEYSPVQAFAEQTVPAFASAAAVTMAAEGYDPSLYANVNYLSWGIQMADASNGMEGATSDGMEGYATEYAASSNSAELAGAASSYSAAVTDGATASVPSDVGGGSSVGPESFAQWHSQGGSNALRDLASSIPTVEQPDMSHVPPQDVGGGMHSYGSYLSENSANVGQQVMQDVIGSGSGLDSGTAANAYASSSIGLGDAAASYDDVASAAASAYLSMDAPVEGVPDQAAIPDVNNGAADALSSQLSELNYDGMQVDGGSAAARAFSSATPPNPGLLSDSIKEKLGHVEVPTVTNPFSEMHLSPSSSVEEALASAKEAGSASKEKLDTLLNSLSHSFEGLGDKVAKATNSLEGLPGKFGKVADQGASGFKSLGHAVQSGAATIGEGLAGMSSSVKSAGEGVAGMAAPAQSAAAGVQSPNLNVQAPPMPQANVLPSELPNVNVPQAPLPNINIPPPPNLPSVNMQEWNLGERVGGASLSDLGDSVITAVQSIGGVIVKFLDFILQAVAGTSVSSILSNVQTSVTAALDNASHTVVSIITSIGDLSIREIIQHLMALVVAIADILLKVANALIYILSGKDGADWALQATSTVNDASSQLMAYASSTYDGVTHATLTDMAHTVGDYSQYVGNELVALVGNLQMAVDAPISNVPLDPDTINGVTAAVETALNM